MQTNLQYWTEKAIDLEIKAAIATSLQTRLILEQLADQARQQANNLISNNQ